MGRSGQLSLLVVAFTLAVTLLLTAFLADCASPPVAPLAFAAPTVLWSPADGVVPFPDPAPMHPTDAVRATLAKFVAAHAGAPIDAPVAVEFSTTIDASNLDGIALVDDDGARVDVAKTVTLGGRGVRLQPTSPLVAGKSYTLVVAGVKSSTGAVFAKSDAFAYVTGDSLGAPSNAIEELNALKPAVALALNAATAAGFAREDVAVASRFTATDLPRVALDVAKHIAPYPSDFAVDDTGGTTLPPGALSAMLGDAGVAVARAAVAKVPGFSTSARARIPLVGRADTADGFAIATLDGTKLVDVTTSLSADSSTVFVQKKPALDAGTTYALIVDGAHSGGTTVLPSLDAALLQTSAPLARDGHSTTALYDDDTARVLENARAQVAPVVAAMGHDVALAVPFTTLDAYAFVDSYASLLETRDVAPEVHDVVVATPFDRGLWAVMPNVDTVVSGTFTSLDFIDPTTLRAIDPRAGEVPFVLTLPPQDRIAAGQKIPVVVFGHGLITAKELAYLIADDLAQAGFATFAIDLPMHGARSVCLVDAHCDPLQHCGDDHQCHALDGSPGSLITTPSLFDGGPEIPVATGEAFVLVDDLVASRDHFLQGVVDLQQGLRMLQNGGLDDVTGVALQRDHFGWLGISLGGIYGAIMSGSTEHIDSFAMNVPGADLVVTLEASTVLKPLLLQAMVSHGVDAGSPEYADYEDLAHLVLDPVDPMNLAPRATTRVPEGWTAKRAIIQMADTDLVVPNEATHVLSDVTGVAISAYHPLVSNHGFLLDPTSIQGAEARAQAITFLEGN